MRPKYSPGMALAGQLLTPALISAISTTASGPAITLAPELPQIKAVEPTSCAEWTTYSTTAASVSCTKLAKRQNLVPHTCTTFPGMVTECIKHYIGGHPFTPEPYTYSGGEVTITDVSSSSGEATPTTLSIITTTADISLSIPTQAPADITSSSPAWLFTLSDSLLSKIFDASLEVCVIAKLAKRETIGTACPLKDLTAEQMETFQQSVQDIVGESSVNVPADVNLEELLRTGALDATPEELADISSILGGNADGAELATALAKISRLGQIEGMAATVADSITASMILEAAGIVIPAGIFVETILLFKTMIKNQAAQAVPPPNPPGTPTTTTSSATCGVCSDPTSCDISPDDDQGSDGIWTGLVPVFDPATYVLPTPTESFPCRYWGGACSCTDKSTYSTSMGPVTVVAPGITTTSFIPCPFTSIPGHAGLLNASITPPLTKGYVTPTWVPTSTPTCQPTQIPVYGWRKSFVELSVRDFCDKAEQEGFSADLDNPLWREQTYAASDNSDPSYHDLSIYIHYEQHACPEIDVKKFYKPTSQQCQDRLAWLWTDQAGCGLVTKGSEADSLDVGPWVPPGGYYGNCMWWQLLDSGTEQGYSVTPTGPTQVTMTQAPDPVAGQTFEPANSGQCKVGDTVHWEAGRASSAASKFCTQMAETNVQYMPISTIGAIATSIWAGEPTERSYPVPTGFVYPDLVNEKSIKIRISHDETGCNSTQKDHDCHFNFVDFQRCYHWLDTIISTCKERTVYDYDSKQFVNPVGYRTPLDSIWAPRGEISGDGIKWEIDEGRRCLYLSGGFSSDPDIDGSCWSKDWNEQP